MYGVKISTYLFPEHQSHAELLLSETARYFEFYRPILGKYPWPKFDIVENFFASGYGMPTYTLLGRTVIPHMAMMAARYGGKIPAGYIAETRPDYIVILPWNLQREIAEQLSYTAGWGAKLVVPIPTAKVIS